MAHIPKKVQGGSPLVNGLTLRGRGKVRDSYLLPGHPGKMLPIATDRCSIFDFVLPAEIPYKGQILTALSCFWTTEVINPICNTDLVAFGVDIDGFLPKPLRNEPELQKHATVVELVPKPNVEDIVRFYLTGSAWASYQKDGTAFDHRLPPGLVDGSRLPYPIYTPTTKAEVGHDEPISADIVAEKYGAGRERLALQVASAVAEYARECGIIFADTKFEFSTTNRGLVLADEKATPDSSRFWDLADWEKAIGKGKLPPSLDKQFLRDWGKKALIEKDADGRKRQPENPDDLAYIENQRVPDDVVRMTTRLYRYIFWRLTGMQLEVYQRSKMGISVTARKPTIEILVGSKSDLSQTEAGLASLAGVANANVSVVSCHRNPAELRQFAKDQLSKADVVIAGAGMAAALPGIVKSELCMLGHPEIPVIGVAFEGDQEVDTMAAVLSIERLPGKPVELSPKGEAYCGPMGFVGACIAAVEHEFLPRGLESKPAHFGLQQIT